MNYINRPALYSYLFSYMSSVLIGKTAWSVVLREDVAAEDVPEVCAAEVLHEVSDEGDGGECTDDGLFHGEASFLEIKIKSIPI